MNVRHEDTPRPVAGDLFERRGKRRPCRSRSEQAGVENRRNGEFMAVFSHELRNSLGVIGNAAFTLGMDPSAGPAMVKARLLIERQVGQMARLVEDVLDESRV